MSPPPGENEKEWRTNDPTAEATETMGDGEPVAESPLESPIDIEKADAHMDPEKDERPNINRTITTATGVSTEADSRSIVPLQRKAKWSDKINPLKRRRKPPVPKERILSREYKANWLSRLTFTWVGPLMSVGYQRPLELNDIWLVNPDRAVERQSQRLMEAFKRRVEAKSKRPLAMALYDTFKVEFLVGGACQLTSSIVQVISPFVLRFLIKFAGEAYAARIQNKPEPSIGRGIGLVLGILALQVIQSLSTNHFIYRGMLNGGQSRAVLISVIFDKAMRLSGRAKAGGKVEQPPADIQPGSEAERKWYQKMLKKKNNNKKTEKKDDGQGWSNGRIVNLMSTDTYRIDTAAGFFHMIWCSPISITITLVLLLVNLTYSALVGFGLIILGMPMLGKAMRSLFRRRAAINKVTDQRVSLTQEILSAVRFVKLFGWEMSFLDRLGEYRAKEIWMIQKLLAIRNALNAIAMSLPVFASMLAFITYSLTKNDLNPANIFSSLALFNALRIPLNFLPLVIGQVIDAFASVDRVQEFLLAEDAEDEAVFKYDIKEAVVVKDASFTWERNTTQDDDEDDKRGSHGRGPPGKKETKKEKKAREQTAANAPQASAPAAPESNAATAPDAGPSNVPLVSLETSSQVTAVEPFKLHDINLSIQRKELIAVIGTVGSGKTSLLAALAGDMRRTSGEVIMGASRAFCPQYAWIQNATAKENIIFGKEFKRSWYEKVVDACALRPDFEMLPNGDLTEIGERGITVSGGQKQRLNIARAIYFDADIVLMDDPLSAVDAHVGRHIMDNAICGLLRDKCVILATHQLHVLNRCDRIVWMQEGRIETVDTFENLMAYNEDFAKLMATTAVEEEKEEEDHVNDDEVKEEEKTQKKKKKSPGLMQAEERAVNSVSWGVYGAYIRASGSILVLPLILFLLITSQGANIVTNLWLSWWTSNKFGMSTGTYIGIYAALGVVQALLMFLFSVGLSYFGTRASKVMLQGAIKRVLRAPMSFFDTTPLGRITNRFSKDIDTMDNNLTDAMRMFFMTFAMIVSVFILIIVYFHYFAIALAPLTLAFLFSANYYRASAREIKRHEAVLRSVVFSRFGEAVTGTATIRAYGLQEQFKARVNEAIDTMDSAYFVSFANQRWLSMRLDVVGNLLVFVTGLLVVTSRFSVNPSIGGLVLSYILSVVGMIQFSVRQLAEVESNMNSTERIHYYATEIESEAPLHLGEVRSTWPEKGEIIFDNVEMRYRDGLPLVLQGLNLHVAGGERIGVVGRTGAGKSSIMTTLFRLVELCGGSITIDGINIAQIGLNDLRSKLAIIPQDPTLFRGTIRSNLDVFNEHTDLELWSALRQANLVAADAQMDDRGQRIHLDSVVEEEGLNFSLGQRQLMALARALVRGSQIIVCDEATSSVDMETDQKIQKTIVEGFKGKTLLTIAHRLKTIIGYDRIVVLDAGRIDELDTPLRLYDMGGVFRGMCDRSGIRREDFLEARVEMP